MNFAERMKYLRKENNYTMKQVAQACGVSYPTYINYENGIHEPGISFLIKVAEYLDASVEFLLGLVDEPKRTTAIQLPGSNAQKRDKSVTKIARLINAPSSFELGADYSDGVVVGKRLSFSDSQEQHPITIGAYMRQKRTDLGLSHTQLSKLSGVSEDDISRLEADEQIEASSEILENLAPHLSTSYIQLMYLAGQIEGADDANTNYKTSSSSASSDGQLTKIERILAKDKEFLYLLQEVFENASSKEICVVNIILNKIADKKMSITERDLLCGLLSKFG